jgi:hypothetical protein
MPNAVIGRAIKNFTDEISRRPRRLSNVRENIDSVFLTFIFSPPLKSSFSFIFFPAARYLPPRKVRTIYTSLKHK